MAPPPTAFSGLWPISLAFFVPTSFGGRSEWLLEHVRSFGFRPSALPLLDRHPWVQGLSNEGTFLVLLFKGVILNKPFWFWICYRYYTILYPFWFWRCFWICLFCFIYPWPSQKTLFWGMLSWSLGSWKANPTYNYAVYYYVFNTLFFIDHRCHTSFVMLTMHTKIKQMHITWYQISCVVWLKQNWPRRQRCCLLFQQQWLSTFHFTLIGHEYLVVYGHSRDSGKKIKPNGFIDQSDKWSSCSLTSNGISSGEQGPALDVTLRFFTTRWFF